MIQRLFCKIFWLLPAFQHYFREKMCSISKKYSKNMGRLSNLFLIFLSAHKNIVKYFFNTCGYDLSSRNRLLSPYAYISPTFNPFLHPIYVRVSTKITTSPSMHAVHILKTLKIQTSLFHPPPYSRSHPLCNYTISINCFVS